MGAGESEQDEPTNDFYDLGVLSHAGHLIDNATPDHDALRVHDDAIGFNGAGANTIDLALINTDKGGIGFDFDVLEVGLSPNRT